MACDAETCKETCQRATERCASSVDACSADAVDADEPPNKEAVDADHDTMRFLEQLLADGDSQVRGGRPIQDALAESIAAIKRRFGSGNV